MADDFPTRLRTARNRTGLSRSKLAEKLRVNRETVGRWENGIRFPPISLFKRIYDLLGIEALPEVEPGLGGQMKLFRLKNGISINNAARKVGKGTNWWLNLEHSNATIKYSELDRLMELIA